MADHRLEHLAVIGPGTLGRAMAGVAALRGFQVSLAGRSLDHARQARAAILGGWQKALQRGRMTQGSLEAALGRLGAAGSWEEALEGSEIVFEALPEAIEVKEGAWQRLGAMAPAAALCLTGSSSLPIAGLARTAGRPESLLGFHTFLPLERMGLVELVAPEGAEATVVGRACGLAEALGLAVVRVRDQPGYAASRMALVQGLEAMRLLEAGVATAADLDTLMVKGYGHPVGPLALSDRIGLDLRLSIAEGLFQSEGDRRFEPPALLRDLVARGLTGRKVGQGFFTWEAPEGVP